MRFLLLLVIFFVSSSAFSLVAAASARPNVVIFLADDLGWADVAYQGGPIETPALDRLAREGARLTRFYSTPICSPTRAALMTGRDPVRFGMVYSVVMPWDDYGLHPDERLLPESFSGAGYQTALIGKWHLGHSQQSYHPNNRGFEHFYGHLHTEVGYYPPFSNQGGADFQRNGERIEDEGYETFLLADEAVRWIKEREKQRPFFLYMPFIAPHTPLDAPQELQDKYKDLRDVRKAVRSPLDKQSRISRLTGAKSQRQMYAAVVDALDQAIAKVLVTLDSEGIAENTIVLFFSDNGGQVVYGAGGADNAPLRGGKGETFEGGVRVVASMRWPGQIPAGSEVTELMSVMDVFPTLASATDILPQSSKRFDGRDMWPVISAGKPSPRDDDDYLILASEIPIYGSFRFAAIGKKWKLVQLVERDFLSVEVQNLLFRIDQDPNETNNLAEINPRVTRKLAGLIADWRTLHPIGGLHPRIMPPPGWRAPLDWAQYPRQMQDLNPHLAPGMPPARAVRPLDWIHGERGRLIYDCEPLPPFSGGLCR